MTCLDWWMEPLLVECWVIQMVILMDLVNELEMASE
jgi:hypothetical protein